MVWCLAGTAAAEGAHVVEGARATEALQPLLQRCPRIADGIPSFAELLWGRGDEDGVGSKLRRGRDQWELSLDWYGMGRYGTGSHEVWRIAPETCDVVGAGLSYEHGALDQSLTFIGLERPVSTDERRALLETLEIEVGQPESPRHASAKLVADGGLCQLHDLTGSERESSEGVESWRLSPPVFPVQRLHQGRPRPMPRLVHWRPEMLQRSTDLDEEERQIEAELAEEREGDMQEERAAGIAVPYEEGAGIVLYPTKRPTVRRRQGRYSLLVTDMGSRRGGALAAVYDHNGNRHRWVFASPDSNECTEGRLVAVGGAGELMILVVETEMSGSHEPYALDLANGTVHAFSERPAAAEGRVRLASRSLQWGEVLITFDEILRAAREASEERSIRAD